MKYVINHISNIQEIQFSITKVIIIKINKFEDSIIKYLSVKCEQQWRRMQSWMPFGELINSTMKQQYLDTNDSKKTQTLLTKNPRNKQNPTKMKEKKIENPLTSSIRSDGVTKNKGGHDDEHNCFSNNNGEHSWMVDLQQRGRRNPEDEEEQNYKGEKEEKTIS